MQNQKSILDDTFYDRKNSKKIKIYTVVHEHADNKYKKAFRPFCLSTILYFHLITAINEVLFLSKHELKLLIDRFMAHLSKSLS